MDRTSWIAVILCSAGMVAWFTLQPKPQPVDKAALPEASAPATAGQANAEAPTTPSGTSPAAPAPEPAVAATEFTVPVDGVEYAFTTAGGGIKKAVLPPHHSFGGDTETIINEFGSAAVGAITRGQDDIEKTNYDLKSASGTLPVIFENTTAGITIRKTWTPVTEGKGHGWLWNLKVEIVNGSQAKHEGRYFLYSGAASRMTTNPPTPTAVLWNADGEPGKKDLSASNTSGLFRTSMFSSNVPSFDQSFEQFLWGGVYNEYFTILITNTVKPKDAPAGAIWGKTKKILDPKVDPKTPDHYAAEAGVSLPPVAIEAGKSMVADYEVYIGPRSYSVLKGIEKELGKKETSWGRYRDQAMFYGTFPVFGWFSPPLSKMMLWLLEHFQNWMKNIPGSWGWAIILLTILVRGVMWPLNVKASLSMKRMAKLSPLMKEIQEKHKDDPAKAQAETMKLYRKYDVNPFKGCLPSLLQIPIFFGLYDMLKGAVEMRGQGFLWVRDLTLPDTQAHLPQGFPMIGGFPINPLPIVMGITMFIQMSMMPKSTDPQAQTQQNIMKFMPIMFLFFCYNFAAALALYWTVSNIIGIIQALWMNRLPEVELTERPAGGDAKKGSGKPGMMELFQKKLEAQMQAAQDAQKRRQGGGGNGSQGGGSSRNPRTGG